MSDFENDPRTPCKYGSSCYRANKKHWEDFKHPSSKEVGSRPKLPAFYSLSKLVLTIDEIGWL